jgi:hypothetical protein
MLKTPAITNLFRTAGIRSTNYIQALDLEGDPLSYSANYYDLVTQNNATNPVVLADGGVAFTIVPGYAGPLKFYVYASHDGFATYDQQVVTFAVGDTAITAQATNFSTRPLVSFTNQLLATFTNGVPNSPTGNFTASINWGDNGISAGAIVTNALGRKEVRGGHTYTNSGDYPIYVTVQSVLGVSTNVVALATVAPSLSLLRASTNNVIKWPAWAADFQVQSVTNLNATNWITLTNRSALVGYDNVVSNASASSNLFFRLKR